MQSRAILLANVHMAACSLDQHDDGTWYFLECRPLWHLADDHSMWYNQDSCGLKGQCQGQKRKRQEETVNARVVLGAHAPANVWRA